MIIWKKLTANDVSFFASFNLVELRVFHVVHQRSSPELMLHVVRTETALSSPNSVLAVTISTNLKFWDRASFGLSSDVTNSPYRDWQSFIICRQANLAGSNKTGRNIPSEIENFCCKPYQRSMELFTGSCHQAFFVNITSIGYIHHNSMP